MARMLPVGIQSFEKFRSDGYVYVDKTAYVYRLVSEGKPYFLARPRRFGKSLLVSTLKAYFQGRRDLFEGLEIERLSAGDPDAFLPRPVFHFDFTGEAYVERGALEAKLDARLTDWEDLWGARYRSRSLGERFSKLLEMSHAQSGHRAAVLVDEYDKPLLEATDNPGLEHHNRALFKGFFSTLKGADEHLRFAFITGVTRFSKVSIFSDLNQLRDISLSTAYACSCGVTEPELTRDFAPELDALADGLGAGPEECLARLRAIYDGYCFHPAGPGTEGQRDERKVYNPFSLMSALTERRLGSYWFASGTPSFLPARVRDAGIDPRALVEGGVWATDRQLADYRADDPDPVPLLFQAGYLTLADQDPTTGEFKLVVPNGEVEQGLVEGLLPAWVPGYSRVRGTDVFALRRIVEAGDTQGMRDVLASLFASIPYTREADPFENYFQAVIWLVFTLLGSYVRTEVHQARGRADVVVETGSHVYVMELKRGDTAAEALAQLSERGYASPYAADPRELHHIGCAFDNGTRQLTDWAEASVSREAQRGGSAKGAANQED